MDVTFLNKLSAIGAEKNNKEAVTMLNMAAFFPPGKIRSGIFSLLISDRTRRIAVIKILQRHSLVTMDSKGNSFFISDVTQENLKKYLESKRLGTVILSIVVTYMKEVKTLGDYPYFLSVYNHAKLYPKLVENIGRLPGNIILGMNQSGNFDEALSFGSECKEYLVKTLGKYHEVVLHLESAIGCTLLKLEKVGDAIEVLKAAYLKASLTIKVQFDIYAYMKLLAKAVLKDNPQSERFLREIVFYKKSPFDSWSHSELEKWTQYALIIKRYDLATTAISILDDICKQRMQIFGPNDDNICDAMVIKAECLSLESSFFEALDILRTINNRRTLNFGEGHWSLLRVRYDMAKVFEKMNNLDLSIEIFEEVVIKSQRIAGCKHILYLKSMLKIAKLSMLKRNFEKALKFSSDVHDKLVRFFGVVHSMCFESAMIMGESLLQLNCPKKALKVFEEILEDFENFDNDPEEILRLNSMVLKIKNSDSLNPPSESLQGFSKQGNLEKVLSLISKGVDIESMDSNGNTPLQYACAFGKVDVAKALFKNGAKLPSKDPSQFIPHEESEMHSLLEMLRSFFVLVKAGDNDKVIEIASRETCVLGARDDQGCTALHWAALGDHVNVVKVLLELGCDPAVVSDKGNSPLHIAASKGHIGVARAILGAMGPAKLTSLLDGKTGKGGNTPLHAAAEKGHEGMVKTLLAHGAVYCPVNASGKTPRDLSKDSECLNLLTLVEKMFSGVRKGEVESVGKMLEEVEAKDVLALLGARNVEHKTLVQVAMKHKYLELAKNIVKLLKYNLEV